MKSILGFGRAEEETGTEVTITEEQTAEMPMRSLVSVRFPGTDRAYSYYNDLFDLHEGDLVFAWWLLAVVAVLFLAALGYRIYKRYSNNSIGEHNPDAPNTIATAQQSRKNHICSVRRFSLVICRSAWAEETPVSGSMMRIFIV